MTHQSQSLSLQIRILKNCVNFMLLLVFITSVRHLSKPDNSLGLHKTMKVNSSKTDPKSVR